jgi:hypothetical protein
MLALCGYYGYNSFRKWEANRFSEINMLRSNQDLFLKKVTELSTTITKVVNDTLKTTVEVIPDKSYKSLKEQVIELQKDEEANKEEIEALREELSEQRKAFLASDDTILIKTDEGDTLLLYRDSDGALQPASAQIDKIIEHRDVEDVPILAEEEIANRNNNLIANLKFGGYYDIADKDYGLIISKEIFGWKPYSVNVSILSDLKSLEGIKFGANINYSVKSDLELGIGMTIDNTYFVVLQYSF